jgi:molecular chaperone Hsp33
MPIETTDALQRFISHQGLVRGEIVSLDTAWAEARSRQNLGEPNAINQAMLMALGELTAASLLLASTLKFDGKLILQIYGDGPVRLLVVECDAQGHFRATVKPHPERLEQAESSDFVSLVNQSGQGRCVVTLDPRVKSLQLQPYQGVVQLEGESVSDILQSYMLRSEQLETRLWLSCDEHRAVGLMLQRMPLSGGTAPMGSADSGESERAWEHMISLAETITRQELLQLPAPEVLHRLFWQEELQPSGYHTCRFKCTCSREKVASMLRTLGASELESMAQEKPNTEVICDFCSVPYGFTSTELRELAHGPDARPA